MEKRILKLKPGFDYMESEFLDRPVFLNKIKEKEYEFYFDFFPNAFEVIEEKFNHKSRCKKINKNK
jgi:hypothetical protein